MEKYPLETLIMLRDRRYQDALNNQRQKKLLVEQTVRELDKARSELDEYKKWKVLEIARRYEQIMLSVQTQKQLATFHEGIASLDLKEHSLEEQIILKENALKKAQQDLELANLNVKNSNKALEKLESHKEIWLVLQKKLEEYKEDLELEDFRVKKEESF